MLYVHSQFFCCKAVSVPKVHGWCLLQAIGLHIDPPCVSSRVCVSLCRCVCVFSTVVIVIVHSSVFRDTHTYIGTATSHCRWVQSVLSDSFLCARSFLSVCCCLSFSSSSYFSVIMVAILFIRNIHLKHTHASSLSLNRSSSYILVP